MQLVFEQIRAGGDRNFGYLLGDRSAKQAVLIDPSYSPEAFVARAEDQGLAVSHVINTHGHPDHINGNARAVEMTQAVVVAHPLLRPELPLEDGQTLTIGALKLRCSFVPGHSPDHIAIYEESHRLLITGDLLFVGKVGGTASDEDARIEWQSLQRLVSECQAMRPSGPDTTTARAPRRRWHWRNRRTRSSCAGTRPNFSSSRRAGPHSRKSMVSDSPHYSVEILLLDLSCALEVLLNGWKHHRRPLRQLLLT